MNTFSFIKNVTAIMLKLHFAAELLSSNYQHPLNYLNIKNVSVNLTWRSVGLKCSHTTAYDISVCQRMIIRSYTQIYVRSTLGIRRVRSSYAGIRRCTLLYAEAKIIFWTCSKIFGVCERIDNTLLIRSSYARHTLDTLGIRWIR